VDDLAAPIGVAIFFALVLWLGDLVLGALEIELSARLRPGLRWLALPITATICFGGFLLLRPLIVDQPQTPLWFLIGLVAIALLTAGAIALGYAMVAVGRWASGHLLGGSHLHERPRIDRDPHDVPKLAPVGDMREHRVEPEAEGGWRDNLVMVGMVAGCLIGAFGFWIVIIGVPISIYIGLTEGDWRWLVGLAIFGVALWIAEKLGLVRSLND